MPNPIPNLFKAGRPRRYDRRGKCKAVCVVCESQLTSNRRFCDAKCRKRAQRLRETNQPPIPERIVTTTTPQATDGPVEDGHTGPT